MKVRITGNARRHGRIGDVIDVSDAIGCDLICRGVAALVDLAAQPTPQQRPSVMRERPLRRKPKEQPDDDS